MTTTISPAGLDQPGGGSRAAAAEGVHEPLLDVDDIQGNILAGFNKDHQYLLALKIRAVPAAKRWLARVEPEISSMSEVLRFNNLFRELRARRHQDPAGMVATWANVAFSRDGLAALTSAAEADAVPSGDHHPFQLGMPARAGLLGDAPPQDPTAGWVVGGRGRVPDLLLIVASDDPAALEAAVHRLRPGPVDGADAPEVVWEELGETRPDLPGHEHFGFKDGVSQPGVRGLVSRQPDVYLTPRLLEPPAPGGVEFSRPGEPLVWPGQFVFGYPSTDGSQASTGGPVPAPQPTPPWIRNGSLLVFRRLRQDVPAFTAFVRENAQRLAGEAPFSGMTPQRLGALLVGRWASGAPVARAPVSDSSALAGDRLANNDFLFAADTPAPVFRPGTGAVPGAFPGAREDGFGFVCPRAAHVRKMNPRDQDSDQGAQFDTLTRRILRRGIPYGPPLADPLTDDGRDRGLHFLCYQTSIEQQFELLQSGWANSALAPQAGGHDVLIGQPAEAELRFELFGAGGAARAELRTPHRFVTTTGGGYFFAPSLSAIRDVLCRMEPSAAETGGDPAMADDLNVTWIHGSPDCAASTDPPLQVHRFDPDTFILRQGKCSAPTESFEAPFLYLLFGDDRALLLDTGASPSEDACPVGPTVRGLVALWLAERGRDRLPLVIAHSHSHGDHAAGDPQFAGDADTTIVPLGVAGVAQFFGIGDWPNQPAAFDLGGRILDVIPLPGHEPSHIALYDRRTKLLLTGDSLYPGLLVVNDWNAYRASIARLKAFAETREVRFVLGGHIEMTAQPGRWFGLGVAFQPGEHRLQLEARHLAELHDALEAMAAAPRVDRHEDFIIYPRGAPVPSLDP